MYGNVSEWVLDWADADYRRYAKGTSVDPIGPAIGIRKLLRGGNWGEGTEIYEVAASNPAMESLGYEAIGEFGISGRRYFRKDDQTGYTHIMSICLLRALQRFSGTWRFVTFRLPMQRLR